jgi:hypothetical protein
LVAAWGAVVAVEVVEEERPSAPMMAVEERALVMPEIIS